MNVFLQGLSTSYPLDFTDATFCFEVANSGRRGEAKKFCITYENVVSSLKDIKENLTSFPNQYNETIWRNSADQHFSSNEARSLCGVQTRPYFEMINKIIAWANSFNYTEGQIQLDDESINSAISAIEKHLVKKSLVLPLIDEDDFVKNLDNEGIKQKLASILADVKTRPHCYDSMYFGFKYGSILEKYALDVKAIFNLAGVSESYAREYSRSRHLYDILKAEGFIKNIPILFGNENHQNGNAVAERIDEDGQKLDNPSFTPSQIIYYGVPGCGKSNTIKEMLKNVPDEQKERVVFHPEYTNADFVGQILPVVNNGVTYDFVAGPFTKMIAKAYKSLASDNPQMHYLVIEEINRGNAAAIFGDVFQLLDRIKSGETDESLGNGNVYTAGWSQYFVYNEDVNAKILKLAGVSELTMKGITFTKDTGIRLPPNLSILATMNTSDQNVFTLDNAFRRRFDSELVKNTLEGDEHKLQRETKIQDTGVIWGDFWMRINELILEKHSSMSNSEDKRLGAYFVVGEKKEENGEVYREISRKLFGEKVLEYLWDDAFKYKRKEVFAESCKSVESLIENFENGGFTAIFKDGVLGL